MPNADDFARLLAQATVSAGVVTGGGGGEAVAPQPNVFFGNRSSFPMREKTPKWYQDPSKRNYVEAEPATPLKPTKSKVYKPLDQALGEFYSWDDAERRKWGEYLVEIGYLDAEDADDYQSLLKAWNEIVGEAAQFSMSGKDVDPWAAAKIIAGTDESGRTKAARERGFTGTRATMQESVDLTDPTTAKAAINQTLARMLGRYANDEELAAFTATLNQAERDNPVVTRTSTTFADGEATGSKSSSSGGVDGGQVLEDTAMGTPDYGAYQAASTYMNALTAAIQSPV